MNDVVSQKWKYNYDSYSNIHLKFWLTKVRQISIGMFSKVSGNVADTHKPMILDFGSSIFNLEQQNFFNEMKMNTQSFLERI